MKKTLILAIAGLLFNCGSQKSMTEAKADRPESNDVHQAIVPEKKSRIDAILETSVKSSLEYLASDALEGRNTGSEGIEKAAVYIEKIFKKNGIKPYFETYRDSFNVKKIIGYNVIGYLEGNDAKLKNEFVILGAHYDHIGHAEEVDGDVIANGANDDASGTVAVLEWAKYFSKNKSNKRSILFTLYSAEEMGLKGSSHLAKRLKEENLNLYTMINFEMIGVPRDASEIMAYISGYEKSNMGQKLNEYGGEELIGFFPKAKEFQLFMRSDNYPFFKAFNKPAHAISTFDFTNFDYYHHVDDEADKMDFEHMTNFMNVMIPALEGMINAPSQDIKMNDE